MKKVSVILLAIIVCISYMALQGCGNSTNRVLGGGDKVKPGDLSIDDFKWETVAAKYNGYDCYMFSLINNSDYDIVAVTFTYKVRDDVTDSELSAYDAFMKSHDGYIEEDDSPRDVILRGNKDGLVSKGEQLTDLFFTVGFKNWAWYDSPTEEQFNLMEPKELQIGIIGNDQTFYVAYYNFANEKWLIDENTRPADTWSKKEIAQKISKPTEVHHIVITDEDEEFCVYSFGVTLDDYKQYVEAIKNLGFEENFATESYFDGQNADGYAVDLTYYSKEGRLAINIKRIMG